MRADAGCCAECGCCRWCETRCRAWAVNTCGGLTKPQRVLFTVLVLAAVALNIFFLQYAVTRAVRARDDPVTKVSRQPAFPFPDWVVSIRALTVNSTACPFERVQCVLWDESNRPIDPAPGFRCAKNTSPHTPPSELAVHIPGALWTAGAWLPLELTLSSVDCSLYGSVLSQDDLKAPPSRTGHWSSPFTISAGWTSWVMLTASSEATLEYPTPLYHVLAQPTGQMTDRQQPNVAKMWFTSGGLTNPLMMTSSEDVSYTWQDAVAAQFSVLNVTVGLIVFLFPMTASAAHQRMFVFDRPTVAQSSSAPPNTAASTVSSTAMQHTGASAGAAAAAAGLGSDGSRPLLASQSSLMRSDVDS